MHHVCVAIITLLHWTLLLACFIIIVVAIFTCFMFLFMFGVRLSYHKFNKRLLTYLLIFIKIFVVGFKRRMRFERQYVMALQGHPYMHINYYIFTANMNLK